MSNNGRNNRRNDLILALARGETVRSAAAETGVAESTAYRWWQDPEFRQRVSAIRDEMFASAVGKLANSANQAVDALVELLGSKQPPTVRLGAARAILEFGPKIREQSELEARIAELENRRHANLRSKSA